MSRRERDYDQENVSFCPDRYLLVSKRIILLSLLLKCLQVQLYNVKIAILASQARVTRNDITFQENWEEEEEDEVESESEEESENENEGENNENDESDEES